ncbi:hypothetical protein EVAR_65087_1 [Eumeta japonica]|uniref:Uncharacterized protein n=1 Tax=Eumeta variegata TaxID=151549 RepID=A0A4C1Z2Z3_EUMVA|nr:hypothetical protein EVAR_65087_1 [Eumeta japonica]
MDMQSQRRMNPHLNACYTCLISPSRIRRKKVCLLFDAAARTNGRCLNEALLTGPDLIQSLLGVLVQFRQGRVSVSAYIKEMFLRVSETRNDDNVQLGRGTNIEKTLDLQWNIKNDTLGFNLSSQNTPTEILKMSVPLTKRQTTSAIMSIFNPFGLTSPVLITGKSGPLTEVDIEPTEAEGLTPNHSGAPVALPQRATSLTTRSLGLQNGERVNASPITSDRGD